MNRHGDRERGGFGAVRRIAAGLHGRTAPGVPRWAVWAAYATTLTVLPSCLWRIAALNFDVPLLEPTAEPAAGHGPVLVTGLWYVVALSVVSEALAYLAFGLVSEWGEVVPRWIPGIGGRRVPTLAAVIPAGLGSAALLVFPYTLVMLGLGRMIDGTHHTGLVVHGWQAVTFAVAYAPLAAWGPLLGLLTVHYYRRRRA
ncbi:hypothetical protein GCM10029978_095260 [Actinoallomurus acanthiterrae]